MANQARVPKFGNWEESAGDSIPYTTYLARAKLLQQQSIAQDAAPVRLNPNHRLNGGSTTPGRAGGGRQRGHEAGGRGDQTPGRGSSVPKFGEWDENNPASADGYTHIFNRVREERNVGSLRVPSEQNNIKNHPDAKSESKCCCCFGF